MMKRIFCFIMFWLISANFAFASDFTTINGVKYVSESKAESIWGVDIDFFEGSGLIRVKAKEEIYYTKLNSYNFAKNIYINPFFINSPKLIINGKISTKASTFMLDSEIYIPIDFFYSEFYSSDLYDVIVVGGDPEGVTAAISAARNGAKTLLLSSEDGLGGLFTYGMLNTLDMNYNKAGELLTRGIFDEFYDKIGRTESFGVEYVKKVFEDMVLAEPNIDYRVNQIFNDVVLEDNVVTGVTMTDKLGVNNTFYGKRVIDATQNADVCAKAGVPYYTGMEDVNVTGNMAATLVFKIGGVDWEELRNDINRYAEETGDYSCGINESSAWGFGKWCYDNYKSIYYNMKFRGPNMGLQDDGTVLINALQIFYVDLSDENSIENAKKYGEIEARNAFLHLKNKLNSFANAYFIDTADELYIREARHIQGEYVLQASDLLEGVNFDDKIAMGSYPLDIQSTNMKNNGYVVLAPDQYSIPYRCIVPKEIENLYIVGKSASYSSVAAGSARVVPIGMVEGESAGAIAMYTIEKGITPREVIGNFVCMNEITDMLKTQGVYLPDYEPSNPYNHLTGYDKIAMLIDYGVITGGYNNDFRFDELATGISSANVLRNYAVRRLGMDDESIKEKLADFLTYEEIPVSTLLRMIYSLKNDDYKTVSDNAIWDFAVSKGLLSDVGTIDMRDTITMKDMYVIIASYIENVFKIDVLN